MTHTETIKCPNCEKLTEAKVDHTVPFWTYVHDCEHCGYTIMESEWETVENQEPKINMEDLFKIEPHEPIKMSQSDFVSKTKSLLEKIHTTYSKGWQNRLLKDGEYPEESVCDKCTGCGIFIENGEERECFQDKEQADCLHRFCDYEQVGMDLETHLSDIYDLLSVSKITQT